MAQAAGRLHAAWWEHPALGSVADAPHPPRPDLSHQRLGYIRAEAGGMLTAEWDSTLRHLVRPGAKQQQLDWFHVPQPRTLVHGDATFGNYLFPRDERADTPVLLDWQLYATANPAVDLPWILVHPLAEVHRQEIEREVLDHYLKTLHDHGAVDYSRAELEADYRRALVRYLLGHMFVHHSPGTIARAMSACEDWDCRSLIG